MPESNLSDADLTWEARVAMLKAATIPRHVAIIMDGNGRWANARGLPRVEGHRASFEAIRDVFTAAAEIGVEYVTLYAFSTENWKRPLSEVNALMDLLVEQVHAQLPALQENGVRLLTIGRIEGLPFPARKALEHAVRTTKDNTRLTVILALNYGGRRELTDAVRALARRVAAGELHPDDITEEHVAQALYTAAIPDPDLLIRTSGELRLSNFLLWQVAYTEFWTTDVCWPDFRRHHLVDAILAFQSRERRYGGLGQGGDPC